LTIGDELDIHVASKDRHDSSVVIIAPRVEAFQLNDTVLKASHQDDWTGVVEAACFGSVFGACSFHLARVCVAHSSQVVHVALERVKGSLRIHGSVKVSRGFAHMSVGLARMDHFRILELWRLLLNVAFQATGSLAHPRSDRHKKKVKKIFQNVSECSNVLRMGHFGIERDKRTKRKGKNSDISYLYLGRA
jgi:hypothetical protein